MLSEFYRGVLCSEISANFFTGFAMEPLV